MEESSSVASMPTSDRIPFAIPLHAAIAGRNTATKIRNGAATRSAVDNGRDTATLLGMSSPTTICATVVSSSASTTLQAMAPDR